ncbi:MAG TPA: hypothetical protein VL994_01655 [Steroidobacteraceae bacterium]|nr:hypothetical protein [Steroidobacteraceae bacterium]
MMKLAIAALGAAVSLTCAAAQAGEGNPHGYGVGHVTTVLVDPARNPDGTTPATGAGRPLYLHVWYPTSQAGNQHIRYTWNNPVYNQNTGGTLYPGLPDTPPLTFTGSSSAHAVTEGATPARGRFPLLVATHGFEVAAEKNMPDTLEALAADGYIVASVEHTGDDDVYYQTFFLEQYVGLPLGPNPSIQSSIAQRSLDVRFVISAMLNGTVDARTGKPLSRQLEPGSIGVLGYSLGGETTLATVTGISQQGLPPDTRVKAAFMGAGSNYGGVLNASDYANVRVPLMFLANDTGIAYQNFNQFVHSHPKYLVDVAGWNHHVGGYQSSWCQDVHNSLSAVNPAVYPQAFINPATLAPSDIANWVFDSTFYFSYTGPWELGVYNYCDASVFEGVSDAQLTSVLFGNPQILTARDELSGSMPLEPELPIAATTRLTTLSALAFFDETLRGGSGREVARATSSPLVHLVSDCEDVSARPFDLRANDRITFAPAGEGYLVSVTAGAALLPPGTTKLAVAGGATATLSYPGFSFPVPGFETPVSTLFVDENGAITSRTSADYPGVDDNGSPWYMRGQLLLSNRLTIGMLMKSLNSAAATSGGGVYGYYDSANNRVVVTYLGVPATGTTAPNTLQAAIYGSGRIELTIGALAPTGAALTPAILGTIGVSSGQTRAADLDEARPVRFGSLRGGPPEWMPFGRRGAIYDQYVQGIHGQCHGG